MAGHQHDKCVKPRKSRRWKNSAWYCDCGRVYRLVRVRRYEWIDDHTMDWKWQEVKQNPSHSHYDLARATHVHGGEYAAWGQHHDLERRVEALEGKKKAKK